MEKKVSDLTPEEFQKTFPITLVPYRADYRDLYEKEKENILCNIKKDDVARINHIGSTAIPNIVAKPIIDILLEIKRSCNVELLLQDLNSIGFGTELCIKKKKPFDVLMAKGVSCEGFADKVYFLHIRYYGDWNELYFRDYMLEYPEVAAEYGQLKEQILQGIEEGKIERWPNGQPNGYSQAKLAFVDRISKQAKDRYKGRYQPRKRSVFDWLLDADK